MGFASPLSRCAPGRAVLPVVEARHALVVELLDAELPGVELEDLGGERWAKLVAGGYAC